MEPMDVIRVVMWIVSVLLIPCFALLFKRVRELELKMETRISHQDAAKLIKQSTDAFDKRFDKLEELIMDEYRRSR